MPNGFRFRIGWYDLRRSLSVEQHPCCAQSIGRKNVPLTIGERTPSRKPWLDVFATRESYLVVPWTRPGLLDLAQRRRKLQDMLLGPGHVDQAIEDDPEVPAAGVLASLNWRRL